MTRKSGILTEIKFLTGKNAEWACKYRKALSLEKINGDVSWIVPTMLLIKTSPAIILENNANITNISNTYINFLPVPIFIIILI